VPLLVGGSVRVVKDVLQWLRQRQEPVTLINTVPSALSALLESGGIPVAEVVNLAGEPLRRGLVEKIFARSAVREVCNLYGPSETTTYSTWVRMRRESGFNGSIGGPIDNTRIYIVDEWLKAVPLGVVGEICIGGEGVARGYVQRPRLTAERFVSDPYAQEAGARMYRTGDLGRWRADGTVEFLGRTDHQVKVRGYRIELGEIESRLLAHAAIGEAVVVVREEAAEQKRLVGYYTLRAGQAVEVQELREHIRSQLPGYMIPAALVQLAKLPLTANGKVDRRALPAPTEEAYRREEYEEPQGEIEQALAQLWSELLKVERVGRRDHFFELGGHSLLAVQLVSRVKGVLGRELTLREVFEEPRLLELARKLSGAARSEGGAIGRADRGQELPLSYVQQRLWFIDQLSEGASRAYHVATGLRLKGELHEEALSKALATIVQRHEALRTVFKNVDGRAVQVIEAGGRFALRQRDLSEWSEEERERQIEREVREEARERFDLQKGPLIRGRLLKVSDGEHVLLLTMHHIVSDGWSMGVLVRELTQLYAAYREGRSNPLAELPIQYADYAQWQRERLSGEELKRQVGYWRESLAGAAQLLQLPTDRVRPAVPSYEGGSVAVVLSEELSGELRRVSARQGTTLFMTLYAGFALLMGRLSGQPEVVIGTPVANRSRVEVEGLIGFFVNTLALKTRVEGQQTVSGLLQQVKELTLSGYAHQEVPFERVVEELQPQRSLSHSPIFQVMFALQNAPRGQWQLPGVSVAGQGRGLAATAQFDLTLSVQEVGGRIVGALSYARDLFDAATIERWAEYWKRLLQGMVQEVERPVGEIELLGEAERRQVLEEFNATRVAYPKERCIQELFEEQVRKTPEAVALIDEEQQLTYGQLNERANRLAQYLRSHGVRADERVGLCVERGIEMVLGLLGILKAGGAYVPLDAAYPTQRLQYMLADSAPGVVLTQRKLEGLEALEGQRLIVLDGQWEAIEAGGASGDVPVRELGLGSAHLAYVIYTSGSTGQPKGVMVEHHALVNYFLREHEFTDSTSRDIFLQKMSIGFDMSLGEVLQPLVAGARLIIAKSGGEQDVAFLADLILGFKVTRTGFVPSLMRAMLPHWHRCGSVRHVICGGEALSAEAVAEFYDVVAEDCRLYNLYGEPLRGAAIWVRDECADRQTQFERRVLCAGRQRWAGADRSAGRAVRGWRVSGAGVFK
jgi:non-ribosomal peptide synthetase component F